MNERRERSWLIRFIIGPQAVIDSGDAAASEMVRQYQGMVMPALPGMTPERAAALIDYVAQQSTRGSSDVPPDAMSAEPETRFAAEDVETGRRLFRGDLKLEAGGASCLSCPNVAGVGWLGGGALGPDLTTIHDRLGGSRGLPAWLAAPPTPSMSALYGERPLSEQEVHALTAFFADRAAQQGKAPPAGRTQLFWLGLAATAALLFLFDRIWRNRFRSVRRRLVHSSRLRGVQ
jgi:hypothetical protein